MVDLQLVALLSVEALYGEVMALQILNTVDRKGVNIIKQDRREKIVKK